eukprot:scaffold2691_cov417-Prasinococcus_capsulatus_cf.AAC.6
MDAAPSQQHPRSAGVHFMGNQFLLRGPTPCQKAIHTWAPIEPNNQGIVLGVVLAFHEEVVQVISALPLFL